MIKSRQRRALRASGQEGFTLLEVMLTSALILVVLAIVLPQLSGSITNFDNARVRSDSSDAAQLAMDQIQHDVVSSNVLFVSGGIVHLQVYVGNAVSSSTTVATTVPNSTCVEYQVSGGALQRQTKAPSALSWPGNWSTVMTGIVPGNPVFSVDPLNPRSLVVTLLVNADTRTVNAAKPSLFTTTVTGRAIPDNPSATGGACR